MPTLWPAISEPFSTSPSITARRRRRPRNARSRAAPPSGRARRDRTARSPRAGLRMKRRVAVVGEARTGITGKRGSSCDRRHGVARRGADEGLLEAWDGRSIRSRRRSGCRAARPRRPSPGRPAIASPRPMPPATNTGTSVTTGRISCASTLVETGPIWPPASMPSITMRVGAGAHQLLGERRRPGRSRPPWRRPASARWIAAPAAARRPARHG